MNNFKSYENKHKEIYVESEKLLESNKTYKEYKNSKGTSKTKEKSSSKITKLASSIAASVITLVAVIFNNLSGINVKLENTEISETSIAVELSLNYEEDSNITLILYNEDYEFSEEVIITSGNFSYTFENLDEGVSYTLQVIDNGGALDNTIILNTILTTLTGEE